MDLTPQGDLICLIDKQSPSLISDEWIFRKYYPLKLPMTNQPPKQLKQRYYYIFWSIATLTVVLGQIYVASSYRQLAEALKLSLL